jgi:hypothetical protein
VWDEAFEVWGQVREPLRQYAEAVLTDFRPLAAVEERLRDHGPEAAFCLRVAVGCQGLAAHRWLTEVGQRIAEVEQTAALLHPKRRADSEPRDEKTIQTAVAALRHAVDQFSEVFHGRGYLRHD